MRRLFIASLAILLGFPLLAASPALFSKPAVVVYPFTANGTLADRETTSRLAAMIATQMATTGKVTVTPPPVGTERKDFLTVARTANADYYVTGYISPLGNGVSLVEQVVSTVTGIVVYSTTAQLETYADAAGQGDNLAAIISAHANRGLAAIGTPPPAPTPTQPATQEAQANLGKLFGHKKKPAGSAPTPAPKTVAAADATPAPPGNYAVIAVQGNADSRIRELATQRLLARTQGQRAANGAAACAAVPTLLDVLDATLNVRPDGASGGGSSLATLQLVASDCAGRTVFRRDFTSDAGLSLNAEAATDQVVDAALEAFLHPPSTKRRRH
ncbi:MAG: hypothetical protein ABI186_11245 [Candidatus Elarobacter sp.]